MNYESRVKLYHGSKWSGEYFGLNKDGDNVVMIGKSMINALVLVEKKIIFRK